MSKFKPGDLIRIKTTKEDWNSYFKKHYLDEKDYQKSILEDAAERSSNFPAPLIFIEYGYNTVIFKKAVNPSGIRESMHEDWFLPYNKKETESTDGYKTTPEGFLTKEENWDKWLI